MKISIFLSLLLTKLLQSPVNIEANNIPINLDSSKIICSSCSTVIYGTTDKSYKCGKNGTNRCYLQKVINPLQEIKKSCNSSFEIQDKKRYKCAIGVFMLIPSKSLFGEYQSYILKQLAVTKESCSNVSKTEAFCVQTNCYKILNCCDGDYCNNINNIKIIPATIYAYNFKNASKMADNYKYLSKQKCHSAYAAIMNFSCLIINFHKKNMTISKPVEITTASIKINTNQPTNFINKNTSSYYAVISLQLFIYLILQYVY